MIRIFSKKMKNQKGFTLVELIVVIAILGILGAIAVPKFGGFRETAAVKADEATMAVLENAARLYYLDNKDTITAETISIKDLVGAELLENKGDENDNKEYYKPQQKDKKGFTIKVDESGNVKVEVIE